MTGPLDESSADVHSGALAADDLVVGFDGSPTSVDALALATPLARLWKVRVRDGARSSTWDGDMTRAAVGRPSAPVRVYGPPT